MTSPPTGILPPIPIGQSQASSPASTARPAASRVRDRSAGPSRGIARHPVSECSYLLQFSRREQILLRVVVLRPSADFRKFLQTVTRFYMPAGQSARSGQSSSAPSSLKFQLGIRLGRSDGSRMAGLGTEGAMSHDTRRVWGLVSRMTHASSRSLEDDSRRSEAMLVLSRKLGQTFSDRPGRPHHDREDRPQLGADRHPGPRRRHGPARGDRLRGAADRSPARTRPATA